MNLGAKFRGAVVVGPDVLADHDRRPYVLLSDSSHPFATEEAIYAAVTSTDRRMAIQLDAAAFTTGGLPRRSFVNPWTLVTIRHADMGRVEGQLTPGVIDRVATAAATYLGVQP